jgi:O-antigen/teichoic acid export membrane protein
MVTVTPDTARPRSPLTMRMAMLFFLPLILTTELHQVSHSIVHGFLARLGDPTITLAAFSIAFAFNTMFSSIMAAGTAAGISYITDKPAFWRLARFYFYIGLVPFACIEVVGLTPVGDWLFGTVVGASPEVTALAKPASAVMGLWIFPNQVRNLATALCMRHRRTMLISHATIVRIVSQILMLLVLPYFMSGAVAGATSLVGCMAVEGIYLYFVSRQFYRQLRETGGEQFSYRSLWRFSWPLMITQSSENGVVFVINLFLGRLADPDLALAAFGVVNGLKALIVSPLRNVVQTAQALVQTRADMRVLTSFTHRLTLGYFVLVGIMFYTPMREVILNGIMGLRADLAVYAIPGVQMVAFVAVVWGYSSLFRGLLTAMRRTGIIAFSAGLRFIAVVSVGSLTLVAPTLNGAMVGIAAIGAAFLAEALLLGWQVRKYSATKGPLFPREAAATAVVH